MRTLVCKNLLSGLLLVSMLGTATAANEIGIIQIDGVATKVNPALAFMSSHGAYGLLGALLMGLMVFKRARKQG